MPLTTANLCLMVSKRRQPWSLRTAGPDDETNLFEGRDAGVSGIVRWQRRLNERL